MMAMRDGAVDDAFVFEILLEDMERRAEANVGAKDVCLAPLHATALDASSGSSRRGATRSPTTRARCV